MKRYTIALMTTFCIHLIAFEDNPYASIKNPLPLDMHGWFGQANKHHLEVFIKKNNPQVIIEVGVWLGKSAIFMASLLNPGARLYAIDHWKGQSYWQNPPDEITSRVNMLYEQFLSNVIHMSLTHIITPVKLPSLEAAHLLDAIADLIYIDASHTEADVYNDVLAWYPHLTPKGLMCGDDWNSLAVQSGVKKAAKVLKREVMHDGDFWHLNCDLNKEK